MPEFTERIDFISAFVDLRRSLDKQPSYTTANALALVGEDLRRIYGIDLRPYYHESELIQLSQK